MHRKLNKLRGGWYEGWNFEPINQKNSIDYITSSRTNWYINKEHLYAVNKLDLFSHVKSIYFEFDAQRDPGISAALTALALKLASNTSINELDIWDQSDDDVDPDLATAATNSVVNLLRTLTTKSYPITKLSIATSHYTAMHSTLMELLTTQKSIRSLTLFVSPLPRETFKALQAILVSTKTIEKLMLSTIIDFCDELIDLFVETITKLKLKKFFFGIPESFSFDVYESKFLALEELGYNVAVSSLSVTVRTVPRKKLIFKPRPIEFPSIVNDDEQRDVISTLPRDIMQHILNELDIKSLLRFKSTNKQIQSWIQTSMFWRQYYLSKANITHNEIMTAADLIYGSHLAQGRCVSFWECICIAFAGANLRRDVEYHSLNAFHEQLLVSLLKTYPELRLLPSSFHRLHKVGDWDHAEVCDKWKPTRMKFYLNIERDVQYWINVDMTRPDAVGVEFVLCDISRQDPGEDPVPKAILDWFVSSSINETMVKIKPIVEAMIVARRSSSSNSFNTLRINTIINCNELHTIHEKCMDSITNTFDAYSKVLLDEFQLKFDHYDAFKNVIEQFSNHVSNVTIDHVTPDYSVIHHQIDTLKYNSLYQLTGDIHEQIETQMHNDLEQLTGEEGYRGYWSFTDAYIAFRRGKQTDIKKPRTPEPKKAKREKKTPHVTLICLFRKVLNLIMMPVLKSLWLRNLNDIHAEWYSFDKLDGLDMHGKLPLVSWYDYYCNKWQPLSSISVSRANPSSWPMSAIVVGSRLAPLICEAVAAKVRDKWNGAKFEEVTNIKIDALVRAIEEYDLFPRHYSNAIKIAFK